MPIFPTIGDDALFLSQTDDSDPLSSFSEYPFALDNGFWPTVTHYFQAMKFDDPAYRKQIEKAINPDKARKLGRSHFHKPRKDWHSVKIVMMTRAVYTKMKTHSAIAKILLDTENRPLIENNGYDYFWGCGRDRRGLNHYGKVLMNVRSKLRQEQQHNEK